MAGRADPALHPESASAASLDQALTDAAAALVERQTAIDRARERLEAFVFDAAAAAGGAPDPEEGPDAEPRAGAVAAEERVRAARRDLLLRALGRFADPVDHALLARLQAGDGAATVTSLARAARLEPAAVLERVHELAQVGLARRALEDARVEWTPLAAALLRVFDRILGAR